MGHGKRPRPAKLGVKLKHIRERILNVSQAEMAKKLSEFGAGQKLHSGYIADYENTKDREPSLLTLLAYSKLTGISVNMLIDDELDIPDHLSK